MKTVLRMPGRQGSLLLVLFLTGVAAIGCGSSNSGSTSNSGSAYSSQAEFIRALRGDEKAAQGGVLAYQPLGTLKTGESEYLNVSVTDVGSYLGAFTAAFEREALRGEVIDPAHVPTGGEVQVQIAGCVNLTCQPVLVGRQVVVDIDYPVRWIWNITARNPGRGHITLTEVLYNGSSSVILKSARPVQIRVKIVATPKFRHSQAVKNHNQAALQHQRRLTNDGNNAAVVASILSSLVVIGGAVAGFWARSRKKKKRKKNQKKKPAAPTRDSSATPS
jgi:hypothetical protein